MPRRTGSSTAPEAETNTVDRNSILPPDRLGFEDDFLDDSQEDQELKELERRLNEEVDEDFFQEPRRFNTLHRVIDVLGLQMIDDATERDAKNQKGNQLERNPAYRNLKDQQRIVEGAIEHMAVIHCADLNGSVIQVGRVARQFSDAVTKVRQLRKQVRDIQDTLGASTNTTTTTTTTPATPESTGEVLTPKGGRNAAAMSLRELWLKKLECEATLALLDRLDIIRAAPSQFDQFIQPPQCRIGAAVLTLSRAIQTMFSDDIAQVQALHKIMEQLMMRKQKAEEIVWDTISDVIYLRTGNGIQVQVQQQLKQKQQQQQPGHHRTATHIPSSGQSVGSESRRSNLSKPTALNRRAMTVTGATTTSTSNSVVSGNNSILTGMSNPFQGQETRFAIDKVNSNNNEVEDDDNASVDSNHSGASLFSIEVDNDDDDETGNNNTTTNMSQTSSSNILTNNTRRMMIPIPMVEAELDLEADERRCLEEIALSGMATSTQYNTSRGGRSLPRYADPVLALRILVECVAKLGRLDDVERVLAENLEREIRLIVQKEQARTFTRLERKRIPVTIRTLGKIENFKEFRRHLTGMLSAFGCVLLRMSHLAEVLRIRIGSDKELRRKVETPSSVMRSVISAAEELMQREIKDFLKTCLHETDASKKDGMESAVGEGSSAYEHGLFSLGIADTGPKNGQQSLSAATRSNAIQLTTGKFVTNIMFPKTNVSPQVRHALAFRRSVAKWSSEVDVMKNELATLTGEDKSSASFKATGETSISYLDNVIQNNLLPVLQEEAVNGTVLGLERRDAFDPVLGRGLYAQSGTNDPQDIEMCIACQAMLGSTGPLFLALHRLPRGGQMYLPLVAVLEHVMLTFISRVKQQVGKICEKKTALSLLLQEGKGSPLATIMERRRPCSLLAMAYADGDRFDTNNNDGTRRGMMPIAPSESDTVSRRAVTLKNEPAFEEVGDGVEGEEQLMGMEIQYLKAFLNFSASGQTGKIVTCSDEELMKAACLAHSLLKLSSLLESRLKIRGSSGLNKNLTSTRALREAIKTIKTNGMKMAKFCRLDMLLQVAKRLSKVCHSSTLVARDAVRIPSGVNELGEYLTSTSDNLREASGNAVTAYTYSSLEQYIPYCLMQTVRVIAAGGGVVMKSPLTMNGIEALDRSGSVLYRDLKGSTSFDNSFWDMELAAISFERSASFMAMMELEMEELVAYFSANSEEFSPEDFELMFAMNGPRRHGDIGRYHMAKKNLQ